MMWEPIKWLRFQIYGLEGEDRDTLLYILISSLSLHPRKGFFLLWHFVLSQLTSQLPGKRRMMPRKIWLLWEVPNITKGGSRQGFERSHKRCCLTCVCTHQGRVGGWKIVLHITPDVCKRLCPGAKGKAMKIGEQMGFFLLDTVKSYCRNYQFGEKGILIKWVFEKGTEGNREFHTGDHFLFLEYFSSYSFHNTVISQFTSCFSFHFSASSFLPSSQGTEAP